MAKWGMVMDVTELRRIGENKEVETVYRYQAKSAGGIVFTELIRETDTTPEKVAKILGDKAARLDSTKTL